MDGKYFRLLRVAATVGRTLRDPEDDAQRASVVVLGHELWRSHFASAPDVVGGTLRISGHPFEIIGVAPSDYEGLIGPAHDPRGCGCRWPRWTRVSAAVAGPRPARERRRLTVVGRLAAGRSIDEALAPRSRRSRPRWMPLTLASRQAGLRPARRWTLSDRSPTFAPRPTVSWPLRPPHRRAGRARAGRSPAPTWRTSCSRAAPSGSRSSRCAARSARRGGAWFGNSARRAPSSPCSAARRLRRAGGVLSVLDTEIPMSRNWMVSVQPQINGPCWSSAPARCCSSLLVFGLEPALQLTRRQDVRGDLAAASGAVGMPRAPATQAAPVAGRDLRRLLHPRVDQRSDTWWPKPAMILGWISTGSGWPGLISIRSDGTRCAREPPAIGDRRGAASRGSWPPPHPRACRSGRRRIPASR